MAVSLLRAIPALKGDEAAYEVGWPWTSLDSAGPLHLHSQSHAWLSVQPETRPHGGPAPGRRFSPHEDRQRVLKHTQCAIILILVCQAPSPTPSCLFWPSLFRQPPTHCVSHSLPRRVWKEWKLEVASRTAVVLVLLHLVVRAKPANMFLSFLGTRCRVIGM